MHFSGPSAARAGQGWDWAAAVHVAVLQLEEEQEPVGRPARSCDYVTLMWLRGCAALTQHGAFKYPQSAAAAGAWSGRKGIVCQFMQAGWGGRESLSCWGYQLQCRSNGLHLAGCDGLLMCCSNHHWCCYPDWAQGETCNHMSIRLQCPQLWHWCRRAAHSSPVGYALR